MKILNENNEQHTKELLQSYVTQMSVSKNLPEEVSLKVFFKDKDTSEKVSDQLDADSNGKSISLKCLVPMVRYMLEPILADNEVSRIDITYTNDSLSTAVLWMRAQTIYPMISNTTMSGILPPDLTCVPVESPRAFSNMEGDGVYIKPGSISIHYKKCNKLSEADATYIQDIVIQLVTPASTENATGLRINELIGKQNIASNAAVSHLLSSTVDIFVDLVKAYTGINLKLTVDLKDDESYIYSMLSPETRDNIWKNILYPNRGLVDELILNVNSDAHITSTPSCEISKMTLSKSPTRKARITFKDAVIHKCELSYAYLEKCFLSECTLKHCTLWDCTLLGGSKTEKCIVHKN